MLKLSNDDELIFHFTFVVRQTQQQTVASPSAAPIDSLQTSTDTTISGLTFVYGSTAKELENLVTREFHADPNLHKNSQVELVGTYTTDGSPSVSFEWTWKWRPPKPLDERGSGWRNTCSVCPGHQEGRAPNRYTTSC